MAALIEGTTYTAPELNAPKEDTSKNLSSGASPKLATEGKAAFLRLKVPIDVKLTSAVATDTAASSAEAKMVFMVYCSFNCD